MNGYCLEVIPVSAYDDPLANYSSGEDKRADNFGLPFSKPDQCEPTTEEIEALSNLECRTPPTEPKQYDFGPPPPVVRLGMYDKQMAAISDAGRQTDAVKPEPLLPDLVPAADYPIESLPPRMREAAEAIAEHVQAPLALAAQCVIGAGAYLAQTRVNAPHIHNPSGMPCSLFLLTLADSGDRKSECRRLAFKTVDEAEAKARTDHRQACAEVTTMTDGLKGKPLEKFIAEHPLPADPRTQYSDATFEPIAGAFIRGMPAASWDTDEGGQVLGGASLKADTRASTLGGLVKAFDTGSFERTRSNGNLEGSGFAYHRRLSVHLLAQAVTVAAALDDPLLRGQGFLPRFLFASPDSIAGTRLLTVEQLTRKSYEDPRLQRFWARCEEIASSPQHVCYETNEVTPPVLELAPAAVADWLEFYNEVEGEQSPLGKFATLRPFAGRAGEIARRLAAVFACFEGQAEIDSECMRRAAAIVRYSLSEWARYTDSETVNPKFKLAAALMHWLHSNGWHKFDSRTLQREGPRLARKSAKQRDELLAVLVDHHQLLTHDGKQFCINPAAATLATLATSPEQQGRSRGDALATSGDNPTGNESLSPSVATLSPAHTAATAGGVATVAVVATLAKFEGAI